MSLPQVPVRDLVCEGTPFEMGRIQGTTFRDEIHRSLRTAAELEAVRLRKPQLLPAWLFQRIIEHRSQRFLKIVFGQAPVMARERLQGIAAGARIPLRKLAYCSALEAVLSDLTRATAPAVSAGCSALAVTGRRTTSGAAMLAHNFDYLPIVQPYYFIRHSAPVGRLASVELALMPTAGAVDGVNEAGLAITCNYAYAIDSGQVGPTITMLICEALAELRTVEDTVTYFQQTPRVGGGLLMVSDAEGQIAAIEISNSRVHVRAAEADCLAHTNRYCDPCMRDVELDTSLAYGERAPRALRGRRVHMASECRDQRFAVLLDRGTVFDAAGIQSIMSDHGEHARPSADTICMHGDYWHTTASLQLFSADRRLRASFSPTCIAEYRDFDVQTRNG